MERERSQKAFLVWFCLVAVMSENVVIPATSRRLEGLADQKNYYPPDPHAGRPPKHSHKKPTCPTPSGGGSHSNPPSHGGGGSYGTPPSHGGGGAYYPPPVTGTPPVVGTAPPLPPFISAPPTVPGIDPGIPTTPGVPLVPTTPDTPGGFAPPTPLIPDPNSPPFTCDYWRTHPAVIWGIFGYWGTVGGLLGVAPATSAFGRNLSVLEALANSRMDGIGALYREGTAALLNSMASKKFVFSTQHVKNAFAAALTSEKAAAAQAQLFKKANQGHLKH